MNKIVVRKTGSEDFEPFEHELGGGSASIGRDAENDIVLADPSVSRRHARIDELAPGAFRIVDLDSGNGVVHQGKRLPSLDLYPGCEVEIGSCSLRFESDAAVPALVLIGGGPQRSYPLTTDETIVGRSPDAAISVPDPLVSSRHLKIVRRGDVYAAVDLDSDNGTRVNGVRASSKELAQGDQVQVGGLTFFFARDGVVPEPDSIKIIQPATTPSSPPPAKPAGHPFPGAAAPSAPSAAAAKPSSSRPRLLLVAAGLGFVLFLIVLGLLVRSPDDAAEREFQEVFQADLSAEARARIQDYLARAEEYESSGNLALALEQYQKILVLDGSHHQALAELARLEEALERQEAERAERERAERERLGEVAALAERATGLLSQGKFEEARRALEEAKSLAPDSEVIEAKLVESHVAEGNHYRSRSAERARAAYRSALALDPDNAAARNALAAMDRSVRASRDRERQIEELTERGVAQLQQERFREAYASFSEVLKLDAGHQRAREFRDQAAQLLESKVRPMYDEGVRLYEAGELAAAMAQFQRVLSQNPDHAETRSFLARALEKVRAEAVDRYKRAYIYEGLGRFREALDLYKECLSLLPDPREEYHQKASQRIEELNRKIQ